MANIRNFKEYRKELLSALGIERGLADVNDKEFKGDILTALGVEYTASDIANFETYRNKLIEGLQNGGGASVTVEALSVTENGTYSEEGKAYSPVTVNVASDFSTAEVTLVNTDTETDYIDNLLITLIIDEQLSPTPSPSTGVATIPLYKGEITAVYMRADTTSISVTGNATYDDGVITITGDCTITYTQGRE